MSVLTDADLYALDEIADALVRSFYRQREVVRAFGDALAKAIEKYGEAEDVHGDPRV